MVVGVTHQLIPRRAGFFTFASALRFSRLASANVCTLYLVFKEPRLRRFIQLNLSGFPPHLLCPAFAFVSVAPFRGTFQLYDAATAMSTLFSVPPSIFFVADTRSSDKQTGVSESWEGRGGALEAFRLGARCLDQRHRVKRIDDIRG